MENKKDKRGEDSTKSSQKKGGKTAKKKVEKTTEKKVSTTKKAESQISKKVSTTKKTGTTKKANSQVEKKAITAEKADSQVQKKLNTTKKEELLGQKKESKVKNKQAKIEKSTEPEMERRIEKNEQPKMERRAGNPFLKFIWNVIVKILTVIIIFISIIIVVQKVTNNEESFFGFRIFRVQTGSMIPKYQIGDVILVKETDPDKIKIGDDITYQGITGPVKGILVTHRVIDIEEVDGKRVFHTQGIANNSEDPVVSEDQVNGVVETKMYILSLICVLLNNKYVFYFCGILPLTIYVAFRIFKGKRVKRIEREN